MKTNNNKKLKAAARSMTVWASAAVPAVLAAAEALKEQLPTIASYMTGWKLVALSVGVSTVIAALRVRNVGAGND